MKNGRGFSLSGEAANYAGALRRYWPLALSIGLFFGWLLSFPMQGPLLGALVQAEGVNLTPLMVAFLIGHLLGLATGGFFGYFFRRYLIWLAAGGIPCLAFSLMIAGLPSSAWWVLLALTGWFSGMAIISWGTCFTSTVRPDQRGRTFVLGAVLANLTLYLFNLLLGSADLRILLGIAGFLALGLPLVLIPWQRKTAAAGGKPPAKGPAELQVRPAQGWSFWPFIFVIYAVGGLMYHVVGNVAHAPSAALSLFGLIPYIILLLPAGSLADLSGRRINAITGAVAVGAGFMLIGLFHGPLQYIAMQTLIVGGYAFLDTFTLVMAADVSSRRRRAPLFYAATLGINVLAILTGVVLGGRIGELATGAEVMTISLAGLFALVSLALVIRLRETLQINPAQGSPHPGLAFKEISQKYGLTSREQDVARMLIEGSSTQEMLDKLIITQNTLKSHLRNIYNKTSARNRWEFTTVVMKDMNSTSQN